jgi:hypothetical protein
VYASHNPGTAAAVAELMKLMILPMAGQHKAETNRSTSKTINHYTDRVGNQEDRRMRKTIYTPCERKPIAEIRCYRCQNKGHLAKDCMEKTYRIQEKKMDSTFTGQGEVNGKPVGRIQIASRTVEKRDLISPADRGKGDYCCHLW